MKTQSPIESNDPRLAIGQVEALRDAVPPSSAFALVRATGALIALANQGSCTVRSGEQIIKVPTGSLLAIAQGTEVSERVDDGEPWTVSYLWLQGLWGDALSSRLIGSNQGFLCVPVPALGVRSLFSEVHELVRSPRDGGGWRWISQLANLIGRVEDLAGPVTQDWLGKAAEWVDREAAEDTSTEALAGHLGITPRQLTYLFQRRLGVPPAQWSRQRRVRRAQAFLESGRSVTDVSERLGFANPFHFSRVFKSVMGIPPSAVQKSPGVPRWHPSV